MIKFFRMNYSDLVDNYENLLQFAMNKSDLFSVITYLKKPYTRTPPLCDHDNEIQILTPYLKRQIVGIRSWSNDGASDNHTVMNIYSSDKSTLRLMSSLNNFLIPEETCLPEDLCFYKGNMIWIATVSHEEMAFLYTDSKEDIDFLEQNGIHYYEEAAMEIYKLPE